MDIYDRIKLLPEVLEDKIYRYTFYMNIKPINIEFNNLLCLMYGKHCVNNQTYFFSDKIMAANGYALQYNNYPTWHNFKYINKINKRKKISCKSLFYI
tara:strand:+ start:1237 stop:1530 length:294 start_codon:yes stop_codon:yes gene_type:complete